MILDYLNLALKTYANHYSLNWAFKYFIYLTLSLHCQSQNYLFKAHFKTTVVDQIVLQKNQDTHT